MLLVICGLFQCSLFLGCTEYHIEIPNYFVNFFFFFNTMHVAVPVHFRM